MCVEKYGVHVEFSAKSLQSSGINQSSWSARGDEISKSLVNVIEASAISVIVFSEGYASSRSCLDELVKILECKKEYAQIVIPFFYRVDPSDVRNQTGSFGDSFSKLEERLKENTEKLRSWRKALKEAASLSGFLSLNIRHESEFINEVGNDILKRLDEVFRPRDNKNKLVGVESKVEEIESILGVESKDVYSLGIWGIGGIGKTTIARAIFDKISGDFEGEDVDPVMKFFNASGFYPEIGMSVLVDKSLIAIDSYNKITMHDLLQELGKEIVRQESINPENRSRLWHHEDICEVLMYNTSLPSNLSAEKLMLLEVPDSDIEQLWDCVKHYRKLNQIIPAACNKLIAKTPNPMLMPRLNKLVLLNLRGSKSLKRLPSRIFNLEFLTKLNLSGCSKLKRLPEISSGNISWLFLRETAIEELPSSIERLHRLGYLDLLDCKRLKSLPRSLWMLKSLGVLNLSGCSNLQRLPECLAQFSSPIILNLAKTNIERIPKSISQLLMLRYLLLSYSESLQSSPKPPFRARGPLALQPFSGIVKDTLRIQHTGHTLAVRWQEIWRDFPLEKIHVVLAGNEIPKWFKFQSVGSFITLEMPSDFFHYSRVQGIAFSAILAFSNRHVDCGRWFSFSFELKVKTTKDCGPHDTQLFESRANYIELDHLHLGHYLLCEEDFNGFWKCNCIPEAVQFNVFPSLECECCGVKKCGIHLFCFLDSTNSIEDPSTCFNYNEED
ncbi:ADP-ribosyl cyclase/cyclic ADP-ribose hydrolase [Citrus sinensis]|nr:ADP-ribosyl cyclase/cyclic ADP-ribose hydrolase [Citrus sinensis]